MESMHTDLLSRDDIISILTERHLKIPSIELLSYEELLRIHNTFAVPLEKRDKHHQYTQPTLELCFSRKPLGQNPRASMYEVDQNSTEHELPHEKLLKLSINTFQNGLAKKRQNSTTITAAQEATPVKRKPIVWP